MLNWLRTIFSRTVLTTDVAHAAIKRTVAESHDDSLRASELVQVPMGTYGLLVGQHWD